MANLETVKKMRFEAACLAARADSTSEAVKYLCRYVVLSEVIERSDDGEMIETIARLGDQQ